MRNGGGYKNEPTRPENIAITQKHLKAMELRKAGLSFDQIAKQLGYKNSSCAHYAVRACLKKIIQEPAKEIRVWKWRAWTICCFRYGARFAKDILARMTGR
jgi:hypothetical protein